MRPQLQASRRILPEVLVAKMMIIDDDGGDDDDDDDDDDNDTWTLLDLRDMVINDD